MDLGSIFCVCATRSRLPGVYLLRILLDRHLYGIGSQTFSGPTETPQDQPAYPLNCTKTS